MESKLKTQEKYEVIKLLREKYGQLLQINHLCDFAGVSRSGYYHYLDYSAVESPKSRQDEADFALILRAYRFKNRKKGARQIKMTLATQFNAVMNLKKIRRLMKKFKLVCPIRKANPYRRMAKSMATNSHHPNHLNRQFNPSVPRKVFLTDITYLHYQNKHAYLSTIKDSCTKEIVAYKVARNLKLNFVLETLNDLCVNHLTGSKTHRLIHSDQGFHYTSHAFQKKIKELGLTQSMSRRGNCWDNAPQESFYGHMKDELNLHHCLTFDDVVTEIDEYMDYYNNYRGQWHLNRLTPQKYYETFKV